MWLLFCYCRDTMAGFKEATANAEARRERATLARGWFIRWLYNRGAPHSTYISTGEMFYVWQGTNISPIFVFFFSLFFLAVFHSSYTVDDGIRLMPTQTIWGQQSKRLAAMFCQHAIKQSDLCDWTHNEIGHNFSMNSNTFQSSLYRKLFKKNMSGSKEAEFAFIWNVKRRERGTRKDHPPPPIHKPPVADGRWQMKLLVFYVVHSLKKEAKSHTNGFRK